MHYRALCYALTCNPNRIAVPREVLRYNSYALQVQAVPFFFFCYLALSDIISERNYAFCPLIFSILWLSTDFIAVQ